jgi:gamma-glutamyltranspeptidase/glutathione hydrolase
MIATPSALASSAGLEVLRAGGNAVDAAVAANAVLAVVYPAMCGLGGDAFWLVYEPRTDDVVAYNGSGRTPKAATLDTMRAGGRTAMPWRAAACVTVPGGVRSWHDALAAHGTMDFDRLLAPAERYAREGFACSDVTANYFAINETMLRDDAEASATFFARGVPRAGDLIVQPALARTLALLRARGADAFYGGPIGDAIAAALAHRGSAMTPDDIAAHLTQVTQPARAPWRGYEVLGFPPNSQGAMTPMILGALADDDVTDDARWQHLAIEAVKRAFDVRDTLFGDPDVTPIDIQALLTPERLAALRAGIDPERARPRGAPADDGDTIGMCVVDGDGRALTLIQSLYMNFGTGIVADGMGFFLQNRGAYFSLDPSSPNVFAGGKRPLHTLSPGMLLKDGKPAMVYGTMGSDGQPQNHVQILHNVIDRGYSVQQAIDAPRWLAGRVNVDETTDSVRIESRADAHLVRELARRGHDMLVLGPYESTMGHAHAIAIDRERGTLAGGSDPRADSAALGL